MKTVHRFCTPLMMLNSFTGICHAVLKPNWLPLNEVSWVKNLDVSDLKCLEKSCVTLFLAVWVFLSVVNNPSISSLIQIKFDFNEQKVNQEGLCPSIHCHCHCPRLSIHSHYRVFKIPDKLFRMILESWLNYPIKSSGLD